MKVDPAAAIGAALFEHEFVREWLRALDQEMIRAVDPLRPGVAVSGDREAMVLFTKDREALGILARLISREGGENYRNVMNPSTFVWP